MAGSAASNHIRARKRPIHEAWQAAALAECSVLQQLDGPVADRSIEGKPTVELRPREGMVVPKGVVHRTRAPERTVVLMVEPASVVPTGDA